MWLDRLYLRTVGHTDAVLAGGDEEEIGVLLWADRDLYVTNVTMHGHEEAFGGAMWVEASTLVAGVVQLC